MEQTIEQTETVVEVKPEVKPKFVPKGNPNIAAVSRRPRKTWLDGKTSICKTKKRPLKTRGFLPKAEKEKIKYDWKQARSDYIEADKNRLESAYKFLLNLGLTNSEINKAFGSGGQYINQKENLAFLSAKNGAMAKLENKLMVKMLQGALGYDYEEEEIIYDKVGDGWAEARKKVQRKHQPGNAHLFLSFMYNRFPDNWKQSSEIITKKEGYDSDPKLRARKIIESLGRTILEGDTDKSKAEHTVQGGLARIPDGSEQGDTQ